MRIEGRANDRAHLVSPGSQPLRHFAAELPDANIIGRKMAC